MLTRVKNPTQYASCYTLNLYCDRANIEAPRAAIPDGRHAWNEFPHTFVGKTFGECAQSARRQGWVLHKATRTATCPKCSGKQRG